MQDEPKSSSSSDSIHTILYSNLFGCASLKFIYLFCLVFVALRNELRENMRHLFWPLSKVSLLIVWVSVVRQFFKELDLRM